MKDFNADKGIDSIDAFNEYAVERIEAAVDRMEGDSRFLRPAADHDIHEEGIEWIFTTRGQRLLERFKDRLAKIAEAHFPDDVEDGYLNLSTSYFQDV